MAVLDIARDYLAAQAALADAVLAAVASAWRRVDRNKPRESWVEQRTGERLFVAVSTGQAALARESQPFVEDVLAEQGISPAPVGEVDPMAFAGVASDGRDLEQLLLAPLVEIETDLRRGLDAAAAQAKAEQTLRTIVDAQVIDAGRAATATGMAAEPSVTYWTRMITPGACARCVILAGKSYDWKADFKRHPRCRCVAVPSAEADGADDVRVQPIAYFESLPRAEQDRVFTKAGAEAIRLGADMNQIVNVRRKAAGLSTPGTRRGGRKMPAEIITAGAGDRDKTVRLLKRHGYLQ